MVFNTGMVYNIYGMNFISFTPNTYCQNNTSASDYGTCYNVYGRAIFVQIDTTTYPVGSLPCEKDNTCIRYTSTTNRRILTTVFNYSNKQAILYRMVLRTHTSLPGISNPSPVRVVGVGVYNSIQDFEYTPVSAVHTYEPITYPYYDPVFNYKIYYNPYTIPVGNVVVIRWLGNMFTSILYFGAHENNLNNIWYATIGQVYWFYESSPLAIIPLDYNSGYAPYRELRNVFGYAANGIDQPGWNAQDIIAALKDIYPNRAWAVFDDNQQILYLYNLTLDYVPDWLINKLAPVGIKVLQPPSDSSIAQAWLNEINVRNPQTGGP